MNDAATLPNHGEMPRTLTPFWVDGRITKMPAKAGRRLVLLEYVVQDFEVGVQYTEKMVNLMLGLRHSDTAMLRRYLVDAGLMGRENGVYWRTGGAVAI